MIHERHLVQRMVDAHPNPAMYAAVHAETSTGVRSDIAALGTAEGDALLITDAVTSIAGIELCADDWGVDVGYAGTQKAQINQAHGKGGGRTHHHTAPVAMVVSLHAGLNRIVEEGLEGIWARHQDGGRVLQDGLQEMGLELFAQEGFRLPELTTVKVPDGVDSAAVRGRLLERHGIEIGAGVGQYAATVWRIGLMGHNARPDARTDAALLVLAALEEAIKA